jgi:uncharacterized protein YkwD
LNLWRLPAIALASVATIASAQSTSELTDLINAYRTVSQNCEGARTVAAGPLAPNATLASGKFTEGGRLLDLLKARGYQAAATHVIVVTGPPSAAMVMKFIEGRYCRVLTSPQYAEIGVRRDGNNWQIVLARPLLSPDLRDWRSAGDEILRLTNAARAQPRTCGSRRFGPAPPLAWDDKLAAAALAHSHDMANQNYFDHVGRDGSQSADRALKAGYLWRDVGENIAAGQGSPAQVMAGWLSSPSHCANLMDGKYLQMGAAYALNPRSDAGIYWTHVFGRPR